MKHLLLASFVSFGTVCSTQAGVVVVSTSDNQITPGVDNQGWLSDVFQNNNPNNDNYIASDHQNFRNYFAFDLSGVTETVVAARLEVRRYNSDGGTEYSLFDVSTPVPELLATRGMLAFFPTILEDLGTGTPYGTFVIGPGNLGNTLDILSFDLNSNAISDINAAGGSFFAIGGRVTGTGRLFAGSGNEPGAGYVQQLVLVTAEASAVPEPSTFALLGIGGLALVGYGWRRKRQQAA